MATDSTPIAAALAAYQATSRRIAALEARLMAQIAQRAQPSD